MASRRKTNYFHLDPLVHSSQVHGDSLRFWFKKMRSMFSRNSSHREPFSSSGCLLLVDRILPEDPFETLAQSDELGMELHTDAHSPPRCEPRIPIHQRKVGGSGSHVQPRESYCCYFSSSAVLSLVVCLGLFGQVITNALRPSVRKAGWLAYGQSLSSTG